MNFQDYGSQDATGLAELIRKKHISTDESIEAALEAIERLNPELNCVIETGLTRSGSNSSAPFYGVPMLIKDFPMIKGVRAEIGSRLAQGYIAKADSKFWQRMADAGFVNLGRTTTSEWGINAITESRLVGVTRNPWDVSRSVAGSSGGAAAAVASGMVPIAHASDGGGSIRNPSAFCGVVGLKPSRGRVSNAPGLVSGLGGVAYNFVMTKSVRDCASLLDVLSGSNPGDFIEVAAPENSFACAINEPSPKSLTIGIACESWSPTPLSSSVEKVVRQVGRYCEELGHCVEPIEPFFDYSAFYEAQKVLWAVNVRTHINDVARGMGRIPSLENLQSTSWALYQAGAAIDGESYAIALITLGATARKIASAFSKYDLILTPTALHPPEPIGTVDFDLPNASLEDVYQQLEPKETFTAPFNISGHPAISLPLGLSPDGTPIGVQFAAAFGQEALLLKLSRIFEESALWLRQRPSVHCCNLSSKQPV
ncbi:amidase [Ruegeria atlantica]|uniref:amidase n=1 Tax=Ruegeria atlantica TaxID=81569 RepID=UPI00147D83B8|nr:amidase family protein [Ruegeria atlantica]